MFLSIAVLFEVTDLLINFYSPQMVATIDTTKYTI